MPEDVTARQFRQAGYYRDKKAAGLVTIRDWCYPEDRAAIHELCRWHREWRERQREEAK